MIYHQHGKAHSLNVVPLHRMTVEREGEGKHHPVHTLKMRINICTPFTQPPQNYESSTLYFVPTPSNIIPPWCMSIQAELNASEFPLTT